MSKQLVARAQLLSRVRAFFAARDFLEVQTPVLVRSPGLDLHLQAFAVDTPAGPLYLNTSPEYQMKRLLADGYPRIVQIGPAFRQDEQGRWHNPEFTLLEWYRAHAGVEAMLCDTEQLVAQVTGGIVTLDGKRYNTTPPFRRMTVCDAFAHATGLAAEETLSLAQHDEERFFRLFVEQVDPFLAQLDHAVFLTEYPACQASLARLNPDNPAVAERFELVVAGVELCNGFGELVDATEQRTRLVHDQSERKRRGLPVYPIDERFLQALEQGLPPCSGNALGLDRLFALACGASQLDSVLAFPFSDL